MFRFSKVRGIVFRGIGVQCSIRSKWGKALGSDSFSKAFWHFSWDFVKEEVMGFFSDFHGGDGRAEDLEDFKLTSLVGRLYKLLAEVLTNRLNKMVNKVVSKF